MEVGSAPDSTELNYTVLHFLLYCIALNCTLL